MLCPDCNGRMAVQSTTPWEGAVWRARKCLDCGQVHPSAERLAGGWPQGMFTKAAKLQRRPGAARTPDTFSPDAGADLAAIWGSVVRTQQHDPI